MTEEKRVEYFALEVAILFKFTEMERLQLYRAYAMQNDTSEHVALENAIAEVDAKMQATARAQESHYVCPCPASISVRRSNDRFYVSILREFWCICHYPEQGGNHDQPA